MKRILDLKQFVAREGEAPAEPLRRKLGRSLALPLCFKGIGIAEILKAVGVRGGIATCNALVQRLVIANAILIPNRSVSEGFRVSRSRFGLGFARLLTISLIAIGFNPAASFAQEIPPVDIEEEEELLVDVNGFARGALPRMNRQQMEEYMYGSLGGSKAAFQKLKRESIRRELDRVHSICDLTEEQWSKLNDAIEIDVQHIENRITSILSPYDGKMTPQLLQEMQQKVWQFASTVQSDKVDKKAVWHKVLMSLLTKEQNERIKGDEARKRANAIRTNQLRSLLSLQRKLGLNAVQRAKIEEWVQVFGGQEIDFQSLCTKLHESHVAKEILNEKQLAALKEPIPAVPMNRILPAMKDIIR